MCFDLANKTAYLWELDSDGRIACSRQNRRAPRTARRWGRGSPAHQPSWGWSAPSSGPVAHVWWETSCAPFPPSDTAWPSVSSSASSPTPSLCWIFFFNFFLIFLFRVVCCCSCCSLFVCPSPPPPPTHTAAVFPWLSFSESLSHVCVCVPHVTVFYGAVLVRIGLYHVSSFICDPVHNRLSMQNVKYSVIEHGCVSQSMDHYLLIYLSISLSD